MAHEILIIRHGETDSNAARVVQKPEAPLSQRGRAQAHLLGQRIAKEGLESILSSDLERARMTALALQSAVTVPLALESLLAERNFGDLRGIAYADLDVDIFAPGFAPPGGETSEVFDARVDRAWQAVLDVAKRIDGRLAVVTHGLVCASLVSRHLDLDGQETPAFANTSVTVVQGLPPFRVLRLACAEHLDEVSNQGGAV